MSKTYFESGTWNYDCDDCGFQYKFNKLKKRWDGYMVCDRCWEPKPLQEYPEKKHEGTVPAKRINKSSKEAMEDDYDATDHDLTFSD